MAIIDKPSDYFNTVLYTGSASDKTVNTNFSPEFIWVKNRTRANEHVLFDIIRGSGNELQSSNTNAENDTSPDILTINSDSFTVEGNINRVNTTLDSSTFVAWHWLANGAGVSNTNGSITSTVSANTTSGFSIVSFTGTGVDGNTVGHGLSQAPELVITKSRTDAHVWYTFGYPINSAFPTDGSNLRLNTTDAMIDSAAHEMSIGSSVITIVDSGQINGSSSDYIYYCFHSVKGFSKIGSYTGNGSTDGTFVYTGFKPAFIMVKDYTGAGNNWFIWDNKRDGYNVVNRYLRPNLVDAEGYYEAVDILSNGFKNRNTSGSANGSGTGYIYMAFAENPFVTSTGVPATAR